jgi:peptide-methionine (S)-S-oxide reductase/peptide methionine sulfoxide reductase msrA/msrB
MKKISLITISTFLATQIFSLAVFADTAYLGGGCFWGVQDLIRKQPGVTKTEVGYMGGEEKNASYELVKSGKTEYAETVKIEFDSKKITYEKLLLYFFKIHDPTTMNQQGNDKGRQYRSVIFYTTDKQRTTAQDMIVRVNKTKAWKKPIVTEVVPSSKWTKAEDYHQDYLVKNPAGYTCHFERKIEL